jgi:flagellar protein FliJ
MTQALATLIKLHRNKLDEMRKELALLLSARDQCIQHLEDLAREVEAEVKAAESQEAQFVFQNYLKRAKQRRQRLLEIKRDAEEKITLLENAIQDEFTEVKKFEIMKERKDREAEELLSKREGERLDEMGIIGYHRREDNP